MCIVFVLDGIFRPEFSGWKKKHDRHNNKCVLYLYWTEYSGRNIQDRHTNTKCVLYLYWMEYSGRNLNSFRPEYYVKYKYNIHFFSLLFSGRNIPSNTNTMHINCCCVCVVSTFRPEYSVKYKYNIHLLFTLTFRPEYSDQYKYSTQLLSLWLHCFYFPAGIFRQIQIQYTLIVVYVL